MIASKTTTPAKGLKNIQLTIALKYIRPTIWRRVIVPATCTLAKLHDIIQIAMGWQDCHLHAFEVDGKRYTSPAFDADNEMGMESEDNVRLSDLVWKKVKTFGYEYDFGDSWLHELTIEKTLPIDSSAKRPICLAGARACPPEDCGSFPGYTNILKALKAKKKSASQVELLDWLGDDYDPESFNIDMVNHLLMMLKV
ncbi:MAG: plasmid pRiA4b ORF-3 family protein [Verrucomicrobia bacterium]|nr:plasmid pRiA4b ORF-3 family protein [Verrucomicrobiota bacterium]